MIQRLFSAVRRNKAVLAFAILIPVAAFAQEAAEQLQDLDLKQQLDALLSLIGQFKAGGPLLGSIALVHYLVQITKLKPLNPFFSKKFWIRPALALVSGALLAFLGTMASGGTAAAALLAALASGVGSMGLHELLNLFDKSKQAERAIASAMKKLASGDGEIGTKVAALKSELDTIAALPDEKSRLEALASWAKLHPPK